MTNRISYHERIQKLSLRLNQGVMAHLGRLNSNLQASSNS